MSTAGFGSAASGAFNSFTTQANGTTQVLTTIGAAAGVEGFVHTLNVGAGASGTVEVHDGGATDTLVAKAAMPAVGPRAQCIVLDIQLAKGLTVIVTGFAAPLVTLTYR